MNKRSPSIASSDRGISLIEIIIVLAILSLITTLVAPVARSSRHAELTAAAQQMAARLSEVRIAALKFGRDETMWVDEARRLYWAQRVFAPVALGNGLRLSIANGVADTARSSVRGVRYTASGSATEATITVGNGMGAVRIHVDPLSGIARVVR